MKFYYFALTAVGLMMLMTIAGIDGIGTNTANLLFNNGTVVQPTFQISENVTDVSSVITTLISPTSNLWFKIMLAIFAAAVLGAFTGGQVLGSGVTLDVPTGLRGAIALTTFGLFASDMWSLLTAVGLTTVYGYLLAMIIIPFTLGFAISSLEFIGGSD